MAEAQWQKRHREIDEIHRTIQARLDASDRRVAEREKREPARREARRARLAAYGLREVSSDELLASVKRLSDAVDRALEARKRSTGAESMAEPEWKGRVDRLDEVTIVQARILERLEHKYDDAIRRHDEEIGDLRSGLRLLNSALEKTNTAVEKTHVEVQVMTVGINALSETVDRLSETVDRFIRGQEGNGRKQ